MESFLIILKKDVQCSLCNDTLIEPKILPCFHTFCKLCIKRHAELIEEVNVFKCPECKTETSLPELNSVEDLKPSLLHSRMVKVLEYVQSEKVCYFSGSHSAASWHCFDCDRSLCDECEKSHSMFTKDHKVVSLVEIKEEDIKTILSRETNCANHGDKIVELFCKDCEQVICIECWKHDHDEHSTINLAKYTMTNKAKLSDQLEQLKAREQEMTNQIQMIEEETKELKANCENEKLLVKERLQEMIDTLQRNAQKLLNQIDENVEKAEKRLAKSQSVLDHTRGAIDYMKKLIEKGIASEVIENKDIKKSCHTSVDGVAGDYWEVAFVANEELVKQVDSGIGTVRVRLKADNRKSTVQIRNTPEALTKSKLIVLTKTKMNKLSDNTNDVIDVKITPEDNIDKEIKQTRTGRRTGTRIELEFMAKVAGPLTAEVQVNGSHVSNSPLVMNVKPQQMRVTREFDMKGLNARPTNVTGIAVNKENSRIAVADESHHCVHVFNTDGNLLLTYGSQGSTQGQLNGPRGLVFVNDTDLVIADRANHRICIVNTTTGVLVKTFGKKGNRNGEFNSPNGVHVDDDGNIIVCDSGNHRVQVFTRDGDYQYQFGLTEQDSFGPLGIVTHGGRYYVSDGLNHVIHVFEKKDGVPTRLSTIGSKGSGDGQLNTPWGLAIDNDHYLLVCDVVNNRIQKFTLDGRLVGKTCDQIDSPLYITVLDDGQLLITSYSTGTVFFSKRNLFGLLKF